MHVNGIKLLILFLGLNSINRLCKAFATDEDKEELKYCLASLTIPELLRLHHSLDKTYGKDECLQQDSYHEGNFGQPVSLALIGKQRGYSSNPMDQPWVYDEKPSKLQTLFHISITALAFLSFGGYLLCLIVQAIKSKGTTYFHPVATASTSIINGGMKRIKIYRRNRK